MWSRYKVPRDAGGADSGCKVEHNPRGICRSLQCSVEGRAVGFSVPSGASILRLRLAYSRTLGTTRISGTLDILSVEIQTLPKS